jgi:hypothetical protein
VSKDVGWGFGGGNCPTQAKERLEWAACVKNLTSGWLQRTIARNLLPRAVLRNSHWSNVLAQYLDVGIDAIALFCIMESWLLIVCGPIACLSVLVWFPVGVLPSAVIGLAISLLGFFVKWIGNGVAKRKWVRMALLGLFCLLFAVLAFMPSRGRKSPQVYPVAVACFAAGTFLVAGIFDRRARL